MEAVDYAFRGNTHGGDEEFGTAVDDNCNEFVEFAFGIIIAMTR